jgi:two-component system, NtrC family, nitrogen regulation sensor histidine kinase NtrY
MRVGLMTKSVAGLLLIAGAPLVAAALLVEQVAVVAQSVALGEAERLHVVAVRAGDAYREALDARKATFQRAAEVLEARPALGEVCAGRGDAVAALEAELARDPSLSELALHAGDGLRASARRELGDGPRLTLTLARPLAGQAGCVLVAVFQTERAARLAADFEELGEALAAHRHLERIREQLPPSYQLVFVLVVGGFAVATTAAAIVFARRTTRRIDRLVAATRRVAEGDLETRVAEPRGDELGDLARAFDHMVGELQRSRAQIDYLQKIGAWQEVARRLAHEIKNPLTPIQLAVQELHTQYRGDDDRYRATLDEVRAIVGEEIANLRRLVDAFSAFAKLPRVEPRPLDLALLVEDVAREQPAEVALELAPPPAPVTVTGDRLLLRRVLVNLVENAAQAGARRVRLSWLADAGGARLTIEDDGPGFPPELRDRAFDPYVTTRPHGTGLGLAIAKKTVLEHGGEITLAPSTLGGGALVITLPALQGGPRPVTA